MNVRHMVESVKYYNFSSFKFSQIDINLSIDTTHQNHQIPKIPKVQGQFSLYVENLDESFQYKESNCPRL